METFIVVVIEHGIAVVKVDLQSHERIERGQIPSGVSADTGRHSGVHEGRWINKLGILRNSNVLQCSTAVESVGSDTIDRVGQGDAHQLAAVCKGIGCNVFHAVWNEDFRDIAVFVHVDVHQAVEAFVVVVKDHGIAFFEVDFRREAL